MAIEPEGDLDHGLLAGLGENDAGSRSSVPQDAAIDVDGLPGDIVCER